MYHFDEGANVNQYTKIDKKDRGNPDTDKLYKFKKVFGSLVEHPTDIFYAFVCRVALNNNLVVLVTCVLNAVS